MPELDRNDIDAVVGLLMRTIRLLDQRAEDQKIIEEATARVATNTTRITQARDALGVFGFVQAPGVNVWDEVRDALGVELYNASIALAKRPAQQLQIQHQAATADADIAATTTTEEADVQEAVTAEINTVEATSREGQATPKISDAIVEYLMMRGAQGAKVADVKGYLSMMYGIETHEKTPGMSLYRLSQQKPPLARREGRTWLFVPPAVVESKNPGAGTPGSEVGDLT